MVVIRMRRLPISPRSCHGRPPVANEDSLGAVQLDQAVSLDSKARAYGAPKIEGPEAVAEELPDLVQVAVVGVAGAPTVVPSHRVDGRHPSGIPHPRSAAHGSGLHVGASETKGGVIGADLSKFLEHAR